jgi:hypothetical protein
MEKEIERGTKNMIKDLSQLAKTAGVILLVLSVSWWQQTYGITADYAKCFALTDRICHASSIGKIFGLTGYNPAVFWIGLICLVAGFLMKKPKLENQ